MYYSAESRNFSAENSKENPLNGMALTERLLSQQDIPERIVVTEPSSATRHPTFTEQAGPILKVLVLFGFLPYRCAERDNQSQNRNVMRSQSHCPRTFSLFFGLLVSAIYVLINAGLLGLNSYICAMNLRVFGGLHKETLASILTGMKPLQNLMNFSVFLINFRAHRAMLRSFEHADFIIRDYCTIQKDSLQLRNFSRAVVVITLGIFCAIFGIRLAQYLQMGEHPFEDPLSDLSLAIAPLLSVWQILPLLYLVFMQRSMRFWFYSLRTRIANADGSSLSSGYEVYYQLTNACRKMGDFFDPFICFSLANSVIVSCIVIYFCINGDINLNLPKEASREEILMSQYQVIWAGIQIFTSTVYLICIAVNGFRTNEEARSISSIVLAPENVGNITIQNYQELIKQQYNWGVTVWKAFPIERSFMYTVGSLIATYAFLLFKVQNHKNLWMMHDEISPTAHNNGNTS